jgi:hypothetical protein
MTRAPGITPADITHAADVMTALTRRLGEVAEERDSLRAAIEQVRKLHPRYETISHVICTTCTEPGKGHALYPCATLRALGLA